MSEKLMMRKKGQAAMEFLMTYGWAILVVLVAIGALAYFGVLSPDRFLPERCTGPAGLDCVDKASVVATGGANANFVEFVAKNNQGFPIIIKDLTAGALFGATVTGNTCTGVSDGADVGNIEASTAANGASPGATVDVPAAGVRVENGDYLKLKIFCTNDFAAGRFKSDFTVRYTNVETGVDHPALYSITGIGS